MFCMCDVCLCSWSGCKFSINCNQTDFALFVNGSTNHYYFRYEHRKQNETVWGVVLVLFITYGHRPYPSPLSTSRPTSVFYVKISPVYFAGIFSSIEVLYLAYGSHCSKNSNIKGNLCQSLSFVPVYSYSGMWMRSYCSLQNALYDLCQLFLLFLCSLSGQQNFVSIQFNFNKI